MTSAPRLLAREGSGGFGDVFRAEVIEAHGARRTVAVKLIHPHRLTPGVEARLRDEARLLALLEHDAIVSAERIDRIGGRWALVMEWVDGADLDALVKAELPQRTALEIVMHVAEALAYAHAATDPATGEPLHLVHRDIKPSNVRVTPTGGVKLLDFGVAHARFAAREAQTEATLFASDGYVAPERFDREDLPASDVFALGVVLWECLRQRRLGQFPVRPQRFAAARIEALQALDETPAAIVDLISTMLSYEPSWRPTAAVVAGVLRGAAGGAIGARLSDWAPAAVGGRGAESAAA